MRYSLTTAPHQRKPQESFTDPAVQATVLLMASQIGGKTEMVLNLIGYSMHHQPTDTVVMYPTVEGAETFSKKKLNRGIQATPELAALIRPTRSKDSGNTIRAKEFLGGSVYLVGSNSPPSLRGTNGEVLIADEIDSYEDTSEGDPLDLLWKRGESYPSLIRVLASTPTITSHSRIMRWFNRSDQEYWFVPCPKCSTFQLLRWTQIQWPKDKPESAVLICSHCSAALTDGQRVEMYLAGEWRETAPFTGVRGFHLSGIYSPWPAQKGYKNALHQMAEQSMQAREGGAGTLKVWVNTFLTETWNEKVEEMEADPIMARREPYGPDLPAGVLVLTCAVDTQGNRLVLDVDGWGISMENWAIERRVIFGNPHLPQAWKDLDDFLATPFQHPSGAKLRVVIVGVDTGGTDNKNSAFSVPVCAFIRRHQQASRGHGGYIALKGGSIRHAPLQREHYQKATGVNLLLIGTDTAKRTIYDRLKIEEPGPRYIHFPSAFETKEGIKVNAGYDEGYFKELTAEYVTLDGTWKKKFERNEGLDLKVYNLALIDLLNPDMSALAAQLKTKTAETPAAAPKPPLPVARRPTMVSGFRRFGK